MIAQLATILKDRLNAIDNGVGKQKGLIFIDKIAGMVQVGEKVQPTEIPGAFAVTKFPISLDVDYEECIGSGCYKDLVPNSKLKGILYFEDFGTTMPSRDKGNFNYISKIRLVCWINNKLIQGDNCKSINNALITQIRKNLEIGYFNSGNYSRINVKGTAIIENDYRLFERYTYPKDVIKFLMHPYEAFGIDFIVEYAISEHCIPDILTTTQSC